MRQKFLNGYCIVKRFFIRVVLGNLGPETVAFHHVFYQSGKCNISHVTWPRSKDVSFNRSANKSKVAYNIEQLMTGRFVLVPQLNVIKEAALHHHFFFMKNLFKI